MSFISSPAIITILQYGIAFSATASGTIEYEAIEAGAAGSVCESGRAAGMGERAAGTLRQAAWACLLRRADMESAHVAVFCGSGAAGV